MTTSHFDINKPVHLARRDAYFERAVEILGMPYQHFDTRKRVEQIQRTIPILTTAQNHAFFAARSSSATDQDKDFLEFLRLILDSVVSIQSLFKHQSHFESYESFLCHFLKTSPAECALPASAYRRRADDVQEGAYHLLQLALAPFRELQQEDRRQMTKEEWRRYKHAYDMYKQELKESEGKNTDGSKKKAPEDSVTDSVRTFG